MFEKKIADKSLITSFSLNGYGIKDYKSSVQTRPRFPYVLVLTFKSYLENKRKLLQLLLGILNLTLHYFPFFSNKMLC